MITHPPLRTDPSPTYRPCTMTDVVGSRPAQRSGCAVALGGDDVLSVTWHPEGLGGRNGVTRVSHLGGRDDRRHMDRRQAEGLATQYLGPHRVERELPGRGVEWTRGPG